MPPMLRGSDYARRLFALPTSRPSRCRHSRPRHRRRRHQDGLPAGRRARARSLGDGARAGRQPAGARRARGREGPARGDGAGAGGHDGIARGDLPRHRRRRSARRRGDHARHHAPHRLQGARTLVVNDALVALVAGRRATAPGIVIIAGTGIDRLRPRRPRAGPREPAAGATSSATRAAATGLAAQALLARDARRRRARSGDALTPLRARALRRVGPVPDLVHEVRPRRCHGASSSRRSGDCRAGGPGRGRRGRGARSCEAPRTSCLRAAPIGGRAARDARCSVPVRARGRDVPRACRGWRPGRSRRLAEVAPRAIRRRLDVEPAVGAVRLALAEARGGASRAGLCTARTRVRIQRLRDAAESRPRSRTAAHRRAYPADSPRSCSACRRAGRRSCSIASSSRQARRRAGRLVARHDVQPRRVPRAGGRRHAGSYRRSWSGTCSAAWTCVRRIRLSRRRRAADPRRNAQRYERADRGAPAASTCRSSGIGANGHIGFNEPGDVAGGAHARRRAAARDAARERGAVRRRPGGGAARGAVDGHGDDPAARGGSCCWRRAARRRRRSRRWCAGR